MANLTPKRKIWIWVLVAAALGAVFSVCYVLGRYPWLPIALVFPRDSHELPRERRAAWNKDFHTIGLADVPEKIYWRADPADWQSGDWVFTADRRVVQEWLANSEAVRDARVDSKPDRQGYMMCKPSISRWTLVTVRDAGDQVTVTVMTGTITDSASGDKIDARRCEEEFRSLKGLLEDLDVMDHQLRTSGK